MHCIKIIWIQADADLDLEYRRVFSALFLHKTIFLFFSQINTVRHHFYELSACGKVGSDLANIILFQMTFYPHLSSFHHRWAFSQFMAILHVHTYGLNFRILWCQKKCWDKDEANATILESLAAFVFFFINGCFIHLRIVHQTVGPAWMNHRKAPNVGHIFDFNNFFWKKRIFFTHFYCFKSVLTLSTSNIKSQI